MILHDFPSLQETEQYVYMAMRSKYPEMLSQLMTQLKLRREQWEGGGACVHACVYFI